MQKLTLGLIAVLAAGSVFADTIVMKSGRRVNGTYLGGDTRSVRFEVDGRTENLPVNDIATIDFSGNTSGLSSRNSGYSNQNNSTYNNSANSGDNSWTRTRMDRAERRAARAARRGEVPANTEIQVRLIDSVDSSRDQTGQTYRASVERAVVVNGQELIPAGSDAMLRLVSVQQAGRISGNAELTLDLEEIRTNDGRTFRVDTAGVTQEGGGRGRRTAGYAVGGAALGAIIGAIAGGGSGAAIGAATGAGAGAAGSILMSGPRVRVPSETVVTFTTQDNMGTYQGSPSN